jgi:hypothetical protein
VMKSSHDCSLFFLSEHPFVLYKNIRNHSRYMSWIVNQNETGMSVPTGLVTGSVHPLHSSGANMRLKFKVKSWARQENSSDATVKSKSVRFMEE